jgi:signal transduction histidine kinase
MKHRYIGWLTAIVTLVTAAGLAVTTASQQSGLVYEWRWFAWPILAAIVAASLLLALILTRNTSRRGPIYWFIMLISANIIWLWLTFMGIVSADAATEAFWQGLFPLSWVMIPILMLFFIMSFVDDSEFPLNPLLTSLVLGSGIAIIFFAGFTNLIERHTPHLSKLYYWGYSNTPGDFSPYVFAWGGLLGIFGLFLLIKAYRKSASRNRRRQLRLIIIGVAQYIFLAISLDQVLYVLKPDLFPTASFIYTTLLDLMIGYAIMRYGLFQISPASLSEPILAKLSEAVFGFNTDLRVEFANDAAAVITGLKTETLHGMNFNQFFNKQEYDVVATKLASAERSFTLGDSGLLGQDRWLTPVQLTVSKIYDDGDKLAGYIVMATNVTELKKKTVELAEEKASVERKVVERTAQLHKEQAKLRAAMVVLIGNTTKLKELDRMRTELVTLASHQLRTPATAVKTNLSLLLDGYLGSLTADQLNSLKQAYNENLFEIDLIDDIIEVGELETVGVSLETAEVDLSAMIRDLTDKARPEVAEHKLTLKVAAGRAVKLSADAEKLRRAFQNLLDNAIKYTLPGGKVEVTVSRSDDQVEVSFKDTGVGIPANELQNIFQKFSRASNAITINMAGPGLGLYLTKSFVELHRGKIEATSELGKGSTFRVTLPELPEKTNKEALISR